MADSFGYRPDHLLPLFEYAHLMNIDPRDMFQLSWVNCITDPYESSCGVSFVEYDWMARDRPSRMMLAQRLQQAERMISNYLKTPVGPTYIHGEMHKIFFSRRRTKFYRGLNGSYSNYDHYGSELRIKTKWRNVLHTGTQTLIPVSEGQEQTRTFSSPRGWEDPIREDILYCIGSESDPLNRETLLGNDIDNLCNLRVYQPGHGPVDTGMPLFTGTEETCYVGDCGTSLTTDETDIICYCESWTSQTPKFRHGHRIRPFHASYNGSQLCIQINKTVNVNLNLYSKVPQGPKGYVKDLDFCDEDNYPERMDIYNVCYSKPDGFVYLRKQPCGCQSGCDACDMRKVPICLEPIDPVEGEFRIVPITQIEDPDNPDCCCWTQTSWGQCCYDLYGDHNLGCGCDIPVVACINYMASYCGNWQDCCFPDTVCPELAPSVAYLATGLFAPVCDCGCLDDLFEKYSMDMMLMLAEARSGSDIYTSELAFQIFGNTRGAYEAYNQIKFLHRINPTGDFMIG